MVADVISANDSEISTKIVMKRKWEGKLKDVRAFQMSDVRYTVVLKNKLRNIQDYSLVRKNNFII